MNIYLALFLPLFLLSELSISAELQSNNLLKESLIDSAPVQTKNKKTRLLYISERFNECKIVIWNPYTKKSNLLPSSPKCTEELFVSDGANSIFLIKEGILHEVQFYPKVRVNKEIPIPKATFIGLYWEDRYGEKRPIPSRPIAVGYLDNGNIGLASSIEAITGEQYNYLYELKNNIWVQIDKESCSRLDTCSFDQLNGRGLDSGMWRDERRIWHNHNLQSSIVESRIDLDDINSKSIFGYKQLTFKINDKKSLLTYWTQPGPDTGIPLTFGVSLFLGGKKINLTSRQCETSLAHKYLLLQIFFGVGPELIDLETGINIFEDLKHATWIN